MLLDAYYDIELTSLDRNLSKHINSISIIGSIRMIYNLIVINISLNPKTLTINKIFGQHKLKLTIKFTSENKTILESIDAELLVLKTDYQMESQEWNKSEDIPNLVPINLYCIPLNSFNLMSKHVNKTINERNQKRPIDAISEIIESNFSNYEIDKKNANPEYIDQILIPPMPFIRSIRYLENYFGIFNGPTFCFHRFTDNTLTLWDLKNRMTTNPKSIFHFLGLSTAVTEIQTSETVDYSNIYHIDGRINSKISSNKNIVKYGKDHKTILKPYDKLYEVNDANISSFNYSYYNQNKLVYNEEIERMIVHNDFTGFTNNNINFVNSQLSKYYSSLFIIDFATRRNFHIFPLTRIGEPFKIITNIAEHINYQGKYILSSSIVTLHKTDSSTFQGNAYIKGFRSNIES